MKSSKPHRVCPWWLGPLLCCPIRHFMGRPPDEMLAPYISPGMTVLEPGAGMGWFTLPMARLVGPQGRIICPELQPRMVRGLERRARRAGLADRIEAFICTPEDLGIAQWNGRIDAAVALYMVHEVPDRLRLLGQLAAAVRSSGTLMIIEPKGHVSEADFDATITDAAGAGFKLKSREIVRRDRCAVFTRT